MTLDNISSENYSTFVAPFMRHGVIIDTCVLYELVDGLIQTRIGRKQLDRLSEFEQINAVFDLIHVTHQWNKLYVTPHILTEICRHVETRYNSRTDYKDVIAEIFPILQGVGEYSVSKTDFCMHIDQARPVIEAGDISIFVTAEDFTTRREKIAILTKDGRIKDKYRDLPYVLVMDYRTIAYNMV